MCSTLGMIHREGPETLEVFRLNCPRGSQPRSATTENLILPKGPRGKSAQVPFCCLFSCISIATDLSRITRALYYNVMKLTTCIDECDVNAHLKLLGWPGTVRRTSALQLRAQIPSVPEMAARNLHPPSETRGAAPRLCTDRSQHSPAWDKPVKQERETGARWAEPNSACRDHGHGLTRNEHYSSVVLYDHNY